MKAFQESDVFLPKINALDVLHYSVIPWISFTSFKHARHLKFKDSVPKIVFGKYFQDGSKKLMPVSVAVSHCMMDGYHVGLFFDQFQQEIDELES